jgi:hypothetical protein
MVLALLALTGVLFGVRAAKTQSTVSGDMESRVFGALWEKGNDISTTLILKNRDTQNAATGVITIFSQQGNMETRASLIVPANSTLRLNLGNLIKSNESAVGRGGLELDFATPVLHMSGQLLIENSGNGISYTVPLKTGNKCDTENALYVPWWLPDGGTDGKIAIFNSSGQPIIVSPSLTANGIDHSLPAVVLGPHASERVSLRDLMSRSEVQDAVYGSLTLRYQGPNHALQPALLLANENTGFVLTPSPEAKHEQLSPSITNWIFPQVEMLDDTQLDASQRTELESYALLTNATKASLKPELTIYFAGAPGGKGQKITIPTDPLRPSETRLIALTDLLRNTKAFPTTLTRFALGASYAGSPGDLGITVFSVRPARDLAFQSAGMVLPQGTFDEAYWEMAGDEPAAAENGTGLTARAAVTVYYQTPYGVESFSLNPIIVSTTKTRRLGIAEAVHSSFADQNGNNVPAGTGFGIATLGLVNAGDEGVTASAPAQRVASGSQIRELAANTSDMDSTPRQSTSCVVPSAYSMPTSAVAGTGALNSLSFAAQPDTCGPPEPLVPTSLAIVSGTSVTTTEASCTTVVAGKSATGCGVSRSFTYQVLDQHGNPLEEAGLEVWDSFGTPSPNPLLLSSFATTCSPPTGPCGFTTGSNGQFLEHALSLCSTVCYNASTKICVSGGPTVVKQVVHFGTGQVTQTISFSCNQVLVNGE